MRTDTLIDTRKAAAEALQTIPCDRVCVTELLQYLEHINQGELNCEDTVQPMDDPELKQKVNQSIVAEQREIYGLIDAVLLNQSITTNSVLTEVYGLGSAAPKDFSIDFAVQLDDRDACSALEQSFKSIEPGTNGTENEIRRKLENALGTLKCH
jgi:hypothetical protein